MSFLAYAQVFIPHGFWASQSALAVTPSGTLYLTPQSNQTFTATGGSGTYSWTITNAAFTDGNGAAGIGPSQLQTDVGSPIDYLSRGTSYQSDTITLTSGTSSINISVITYDPISLNPASATVAVSTTQQFNVSGGYCLSVPGSCTNAASTWSVVSGGASGSISSTGLFTATATPGTVVIQVADSIGESQTATITVTNTLTIVPASIKLPVYSTMLFSALLGTTPYAYSVFAGSGAVGCNPTVSGAHTSTTNPITVSSTTGCPSRGVIQIDSEQICYTGTTATTFTGTSFGGTSVLRGCNGTTAAAHSNGTVVNLNKSIYTAPSTTGSATVRVTDAGSATSDSTVTVIKPTNISVGGAFACALYSSGDVKCWGENTNGQLGVGSTSNIGDLGTELGGQNSFVAFGSGRTASKIATGLQHACALLDDSTIKCWGDNAYGQLGINSTTDSSSPALVSFSLGKTPDNIWAFGYNTCVHFSDNTAQCWGYNGHGEAGVGNTTTPVKAPPAGTLNFGGTLHPTKMVGSNTAICAMLNDGSVQCWGDNNLSTAGQLGDGTGVDKTSPTTTGINLGASRTAVDIAGSNNSVTTVTSEGNFCAALDDGTVKCWGRNSTGQFGNGGTTSSNAPTASNSIGFNATKIFTGYRNTCAMSAQNHVRCWGRNTEGQLLIGSTTSKNNASTTLCQTTLNMAGGLAAGVTASLTATSTTNCTANGRLLIDSEVICYTTVTSATVLSTLTRGCAGTTAAAHSNGATIIGLTSFGDTAAVSSMSLGGKNGCIITGGGSTDNDRIKCWGSNLNTGGTAQSGILLYHSAVTGTTASYIGDSTAEIGSNLPFLNH